MPALVLDSGALIAADRGDREFHARLRAAEQAGLELRTNGAVMAETWREDGGRQARLARLLKAVEVVAVDEHVGRRAGVLLGAADAEDPIDATVVAVAATGDHILTSDPRDITGLIAASRRAIHVMAC